MRAFCLQLGLRLRAEAYRNGTPLNYNQTSAALTRLKKREETAWLNEVSCVPTQQALRHLQSAFKHFFDKRAKYPSFKKKRHAQSAEYTRRAFKFDSANQTLSISGLGTIKVRWSRRFQSEPTSVTITKDACGRYFVSLCLDEHFEPLPKTGQSVGMDLGLNRLATLSNGERILNPKHGAGWQKKLAKAQRELARKTKGSHRRHKARLKVARLQAKIKNARPDHLHKVTTDLVRRFDRICIEDLNVRGMVKNHCLARAVSDAGFGLFRSLLEYKCAQRERELVAIDRFFPSSKTCSACGAIQEKLGLEVRHWKCACGAEHDRDENAAKNIWAFGQSATARGELVRHGVASVALCAVR